MKNNLADAEKKSRVHGKELKVSVERNVPNRSGKKDPNLIGEVKDVIKLALAEADWYHNGPMAKKSNVVERPSIKGNSGLVWKPDLVIPGKESSEICCIVFCIDSNSVKGGELDRALAATQDLDLKVRLALIVIKTADTPIGNRYRKIISSYKDLFDSQAGGAEFVPWNPHGRSYLVERLLSVVSGIFPRQKGAKTIGQTLAALHEKSANLFGRIQSVEASSKVPKLLKEIKEREPHLSYGRIIARAIRMTRVCTIRLAFELDRIPDISLERMLRQYLKSEST